jgi:hypothetical protein
MAQQAGPRGRGNKRSSGPSGGRGNGLRAVNLRAVPWGFLRAVERDFFVEYVEKPTDKTRWRGRLFRWKLCCWEAFENEPGRRRWEHEREVQMRAMPRPTQSEFFERSSHLKPPAEAPAIRLVDDQFPSWQPCFRRDRPLPRRQSPFCGRHRHRSSSLPPEILKPVRTL